MSTTTETAPVPDLPRAAPYPVDLEPGKDYYWCSCGKSQNQPFCDGSHKGSSFKPVKFTVDEAKKYFLCGCKLAESAPFCDGTHRKEKGLKRYNEFLLKANQDLKEKYDREAKLRKLMTASTVVAVVAIAVYHIVVPYHK
ncbi:uncharacterized protein BJ171DRAFT_600098 [Polychytrium aggregatum]|uniref:uncharacterized protein n=1 Tax=Polychytrium aggregatum TaxID=110093 RepID=UPI0022FE9EBD|nr:uncharacterized protein BJ171DRAFT_600098 [Polychytrium aggregatum]KAI9203552.1 hypothetical protein BJ171DRAFT_600098 [Polychytrium aggregatum]